MKTALTIALLTLTGAIAAQAENCEITKSYSWGTPFGKGNCEGEKFIACYKSNLYECTVNGRVARAYFEDSFQRCDDNETSCQE